ncbi:hypothetical protein BDK51DRAFT_40041 [Blyttiomyces helicus]|uniref:Longin domain-containing protein n=1 Tax=Blyttiomyces helicus TaxID=388810 RepID=A0A4P9W784_9FUNG|nr:hypothetical protein BDK51DRAFT_40041 [Blyttiomyces helicus]|eukprot:RKO87922.1 hypothetical protein BDK51DRAFT_40041 [Blyttiomyces helicus]
MIRLTLLARVRDGTPLVATMESQREEEAIAHHKRLAKSLLKLFNPDYTSDPLAPKGSVFAGDFSFQ